MTPPAARGSANPVGTAGFGPGPLREDWPPRPALERFIVAWSTAVLLPADAQSAHAQEETEAPRLGRRCASIGIVTRPDGEAVQGPSLQPPRSGPARPRDDRPVPQSSRNSQTCSSRSKGLPIPDALRVGTPSGVIEHFGSVCRSLLLVGDQGATSYLLWSAPVVPQIPRDVKRSPLPPEHRGGSRCLLRVGGLDDDLRPPRS